MNIVDLNICRVCLAQVNKNTCKSILKIPLISQKFEKCTQIKVSPDDGLPSNICDDCLVRLKLSFDFHLQAVKSNEHLYKFSNKIHDEFNKLTSLTKPLKKLSPKEIQVLYNIYKKKQTVQNENDESEKITIENLCENVLYDTTENIIIEEASDEQQILEFFNNELNGEEERLQEELYTNKDTENEQEVLIVTEIIPEEESEQILNESINETVPEESVDIYQDEDFLDINDPSISTEINTNNYDDEESFNDKNSQNSFEIVLGENEDFNNIEKDINDTLSISQQNNIIEVIEKNNVKSKNKSRKKILSHYCIECNKDFSSKSNLQRHLITHKGYRPYICEICKKSFTQKVSLKKHMLLHAGIKPHACEVCGRGFTQITTLRFHMRRHTGEKPFSCEDCGRKFRMKDALKRHCFERHTAEGVKLFACSVCNQSLRSKNSLITHMKKHKKEKNSEQYECKVCKKVLKSKSSLKAHIQRHTQVQMIECNRCSSLFVNKMEFNRHLKIHDEEKPYKCDKCDKSFNDESLLFDHKEFLHKTLYFVKTDNEKMYSCELCSKSYKIRENMIHHMKTHKVDSCETTLDDEYENKKHDKSINRIKKCNRCDALFMTMKDLNKHFEISPDCRAMECEECNEIFYSIKLYNAHVVEHQLIN